MGENQRAKLVAAQRAADEATERAERAETETQEARSISAADREAATCGEPGPRGVGVGDEEDAGEGVLGRERNLRNPDGAETEDRGDLSV